jgi:AcrR family transcriptional regulator
MATTGPRLASDSSDGNTARDQLIEAASQIMREGDTIDLSLSELSLRAGLNSALVKYYFGNKNGLMLALLDRDMGNIVQRLGALVAKLRALRNCISSRFLTSMKC